ncbi:PepSY domain-containing protein [Gracilibacillus salinarum]|uniref:PepSY domain-containing protein n=1 Tax=Gracilibacillus salinarum TaxID=2932255 RepID=A0ABY4GSX2_9BACI|nr:PepSY domain-containing protein [Gracilibacillus salinarum]UOQ86332.1 PepSY domain-containing protein [Gracilibacillus salinarum]
MNRKNIFIVVFAFIVGYILGKQLDQKQRLKPENVLKMVKAIYQRQFEVSGSWIYMKPELHQKNNIQYDVYHGGITKQIDGKDVPYEFFVDAYTGTLIEIFPQHG